MDKLNKSNSTQGKFSFEEAKLYITAAIILFHIFPLVLKAFGEVGNALFDSLLMLVLNPIFISVILLIYGAKQGFNAKMPLLCILLATISVPMYHNIEIDPEMGLLYHYLVSTTISLIMYSLFAFASTWIGSFVKRLLF